MREIVACHVAMAMEIAMFVPAELVLANAGPVLFPQGMLCDAVGVPASTGIVLRPLAVVAFARPQTKVRP